MKFEYVAKNNEGKEVKDVIEADSKGEALLKLQQEDLYVMKIEEVKLPFYKRELSLDIPFLGGVSDTDLVLFSRQLAIMIESQIGIIESLKILALQIQNDQLKEIVTDVAKRVEEGEPFSQALRKHDDVFSTFYVGAVESGEASGNLPQSLAYLEEHIERNSKFKKKLIGALIYPLFIIFVFSFVVAFLLIFVIPDLVEMIEELDADMPFVTQLVITSSDFVVNWGPIVLPALIISFIVFLRVIKTEKGKKIFDSAILQIPLFGEFIKKVNLTYFAESMSTLVSSGLDMVQALEVTEKIISNQTYTDLTAEIKQGVKEGREISASMQKKPKYFPDMVTQMIIVGERTGKMKRILDSIVRFYRDEVERQMDSIIKIAEPLLIILLGIMVGGLVVAVLLPIYNIGMGM